MVSSICAVKDSKNKHMKVFKKKIILASKSPRRSQLLKEAGIPFEIKTKEVEETYPVSLPIEDVASFIARKKALAAKEFLNKDSMLLTADSVVVLGNKVYGKPKDTKEARQFLKELSGKAHKVITGVCLLSNEKEVTFSSESIVHFSELSDDEINYYVANYKPLDKAGAYAIQEWIGICKIKKIEGTYTNIMGIARR